MPECPSLSRILSFVLGEMSEADGKALLEHVRGCRSCREALWNLRVHEEQVGRMFAQPEEEVPEIVRLAHLPPWPVVGDVWLARSAAGDVRLILVLKKEEDALLTCTLCSGRREMAADRDIILPVASPYCDTIMVETWNQFPIGRGNRTSFLDRAASLSPRTASALFRIGLGLQPEPPGDWKRGAPLTEPDDPRADFQLEEAAVARRFAAPILVDEPDRPVPTPGDSPKPNTCPRRQELGPWERGEGLDRWEDSDGEPVCSFCGSLRPDRFFEMVEAGYTVLPTDKDYKAYIRRPDGKQFKFYFQHLDAEGRRRFSELYRTRRMRLDWPHYFYTTPYFMWGQRPREGA